MSPAKPPTLTIVEDEAFIAETLRLMLESMGFDVLSVCFSGEEAVAAIDRLSAEGAAPDIALMDITLPGKMNGIEAAIEINSRHDTAIVFLTGYDQSSLYNELKTARYYGYIVKPVKPEHLRSALEYALSRKRQDSKKKTSRRNNVRG